MTDGWHRNIIALDRSGWVLGRGGKIVAFCNRTAGGWLWHAQGFVWDEAGRRERTHKRLRDAKRAAEVATR